MIAFVPLNPTNVKIQELHGPSFVRQRDLGGIAPVVDRFACKSDRVAEYVRIELESGEVVCERCLMATNPALRLRGLLGKKELAAEEGILLRPCSSVHTMFMRFSIDVVFCDNELRVLSVSADVPRWRTRSKRSARCVIELRAGQAEKRNVVPGETLKAVPLGA